MRNRLVAALCDYAGDLAVSQTIDGAAGNRADHRRWRVAWGRAHASVIVVQTSTRDPVTLITIVVLLTIVAFAASIGPARRATRLDPLHALRHE